MNDQNDQPQISSALVICGTCDNAFRMHAGRASCPGCGGDATIIVSELTDVTPGAQEAAREGENASDASGSEPTTPPIEQPAAESPAGGETGQDSPSAPGSPPDPVEA